MYDAPEQTAIPTKETRVTLCPTMRSPSWTAEPQPAATAGIYLAIFLPRDLKITCELLVIFLGFLQKAVKDYQPILSTFHA